MALERLWRILELKNMSPVTLSITTGVSNCGWPISMSAMLIALLLYKLAKRAPCSDSIAFTTMLCMVFNFICIGIFIGDCFSGDLLWSADFFWFNDILLLWFWLQDITERRHHCGCDGIMIISVIVTMLTNYLGTVRNDSDNTDQGIPLRYLTAASFFPES